jgi:hypothetical protein
MSIPRFRKAILTVWIFPIVVGCASKPPTMDDAEKQLKEQLRVWQEAGPVVFGMQNPKAKTVFLDEHAAGGVAGHKLLSYSIVSQEEIKPGLFKIDVTMELQVRNLGLQTFGPPPFTMTKHYWIEKLREQWFISDDTMHSKVLEIERSGEIEK